MKIMNKNGNKKHRDSLRGVGVTLRAGGQQVVEIPIRHITMLSSISFRSRQSGWQRVNRE